MAVVHLTPCISLSFFCLVCHSSVLFLTHSHNFFYVYCFHCDGHRPVCPFFLFCTFAFLCLWTTYVLSFMHSNFFVFSYLTCMSCLSMSYCFHCDGHRPFCPFLLFCTFAFLCLWTTYVPSFMHSHLFVFSYLTCMSCLSMSYCFHCDGHRPFCPFFCSVHLLSCVCGLHTYLPLCTLTYLCSVISPVCLVAVKATFPLTHTLFSCIVLLSHQYEDYLPACMFGKCVFVFMSCVVALSLASLCIF